MRWLLLQRSQDIKKKKRKRTEAKMPPTTLTAHIAMVTGSSAAPVSSIFVQVKASKALAARATRFLATTSPHIHSLPATPPSRYWLLHTYVRFGSVIGCLFLCRTEMHHEKGKKKGKNYELIKVTGALGTFIRHTGDTLPKRSKASVMAMVHYSSSQSFFSFFT